MALLESTLDPVALGRARALLKPPMRRESILPVMGAAALAAVSALVLAYSMLLVPPASPGRVSRAAVSEPPARILVTEQPAANTP